MEFSVVVPCFNEESGIVHTLEELRDNLPAEGGWEVIVVDDGSTDGSWALLEEFRRRHAWLRLYRHQANSGYGAALKTGVHGAKGEFVVITDADGTYPNDRIPALVEEARDLDMLVGSRTGDSVHYSRIRAFPKWFLRRWVQFLCNTDVSDMNSGLRVFRRDTLMRYIGMLPDGFSFTTTITIAMLRRKHRVRYVPISYRRRSGRSKIKPFRDTFRFVQLILRTGMYFAPLRILLPVSLVLLGLAVASAAYDVLVLRNLADKTILLFLFSMNTGMFALLADMIDQRSA